MAGSEGGSDVGGRPSIYTPELALQICRRLADGESLRKICRDDAMPDRSTVTLWVIEDREGFSVQYTRARQAQGLVWADEIIDIADESGWDVDLDADGNPFVRGEVIARSRLRVDTRKWALSKVLPKVYGDRLALTGEDGGPVAIAVEVAEVRERLANRIGEIAGRLAPVPATNGKPAGNGSRRNGKHL